MYLCLRTLVSETAGPKQGHNHKSQNYFETEIDLYLRAITEKQYSKLIKNPICPVIISEIKEIMQIMTCYSHPSIWVEINFTTPITNWRRFHRVCYDFVRLPSILLPDNNDLCTQLLLSDFMLVDFVSLLIKSTSILFATGCS